MTSHKLDFWSNLWGSFFMAKYSYEFKLQVVQAYLDGEGGYRYLSKKYGVPSKRDIEKYAIAIDLDGVEEKHIGSLFKQFSNGRIYPPNIVVSSGNGLHLYYILKHRFI